MIFRHLPSNNANNTINTSACAKGFDASKRCSVSDAHNLAHGPIHNARQQAF